MKNKNLLIKKAIFHLVIFLLISINLLGQEPFEGYKNGLKITGTKVERNISGETEWHDRDSSSYLYDEQQRLIKKEDYYFKDTIWKENSRTLFEYESEGHGYIQTNQSWSADELKEKKYKIAQVFNEQNQLVNFIIAEWIAEDWVNQSRTNYQYDESGNITYISLFVSENGEWRLEWENIIEFDSLGNQFSDISRGYNIIGFKVFERGNKLENDTLNGLPVIDHFRLEGGDWVWQRREIKYFSGNNVLDSTIVHWHYGDTIKNILEYNTANQLIRKTSFKWENNMLQPYWVTNYGYDENGYRVLVDPLIWSNEASAFLEYEAGQREWTYSDDGTLLKEVDYTGLAIEYASGVATNRNITYYSTPLTVSINKNTKDYALQIFPNPTNQFLQIKIEGNNIVYPLQLRILNLHGQEIMRHRVDVNLSTLSLAELPAGPYFVQLQDEFGRIKVSKVMKH